jgi:hypothetical protein
VIDGLDDYLDEDQLADLFGYTPDDCVRANVPQLGGHGRPCLETAEIIARLCGEVCE